MGVVGDSLIEKGELFVEYLSTSEIMGPINSVEDRNGEGKTHDHLVGLVYIVGFKLKHRQ